MQRNFTNQINKVITNPESVGLPYTYLRSGQLDAISWVHDQDWLYERDDNKVKVIEAPTGTGKTGIVLTLSAMFPDQRILVLCATKLEQAQYENNVTELYDGFVSVKGRNNFHCHLENPSASVECSTSTCFEAHVDTARCSVYTEGGEKFKCPIRMDCAYFQQLESIKSKKIVVTNYAYGLTMLNFNSDAFGKFDIIVSDEGHVLDQMLEQFIQVRLSSRQIDNMYSIPLPDYEKVPQWKRWCTDHSYAIDKLYHDTHNLSPKDMSKEELRLAKRSQSVKESFDEIKEMDNAWIVENDGSKRKPKSYIEFKPVWVTEKSKEVLFDHANRHIIMSGTIPSSEELARKVGLKTHEFEFHRLPYEFPVENRPIIVNPVASMSAKYIDISLPIIIDAIDQIINKNIDKKILIHTVNYKIAEALKRTSKHSRHMFTHNSRDRLKVLSQFKKASAPAILVSPSFDKAVDLPDKECELIIVAKLPYPYLGSKVMQARIKSENGRRYYNHETMMSLIQMFGRGVRSETDVCPTIILDSGAVQFIKTCRTQKLIPQGINEAIVGV